MVPEGNALGFVDRVMIASSVHARMFLYVLFVRAVIKRQLKLNMLLLLLHHHD